MKSRKTKTATKKMWANDANCKELLQYLKAMHKAASTNPTKESGSNDLPKTVQVTTKYLNALRKAVGKLIDPETAEVNWRYAEMIDPYGDYEYIPPHFQCTGRAHFARAPGTDVWIDSEDLPDATIKRLSEIHSSRSGQTAAKMKSRQRNR